MHHGVCDCEAAGGAGGVVMKWVVVKEYMGERVDLVRDIPTKKLALKMALELNMERHMAKPGGVSYAPVHYKIDRQAEEVVA